MPKPTSRSPCVPPLAPGHRVEILNPQGIFALKHRKRPVYGVVTHKDGAYIMVRPSHTQFEVELYPNELRYPVGRQSPVEGG